MTSPSMATLSASTMNASSAKAHHHHHHHKASSSSGAVNYISLGINRVKELSMPAVNLYQSLNSSQRKVALATLAFLFFWPSLILALNLPWMLVAAGIGYAAAFGVNKLVFDSKEAVKEHLEVDVDEKRRLMETKFSESQFPGKEYLIYGLQRGKEWTLIAYQTSLLLAMKFIDWIVTVVLKTARSAKEVAVHASVAGPCGAAKESEIVQEERED